MTNKTSRKLTSFGKGLRVIRKDADDLMFDMAKKTGVSSSYISSLDWGYEHPTCEFFSNVVKAYGLDEEERDYLRYTFSYVRSQPLNERVSKCQPTI